MDQENLPTIYRVRDARPMTWGDAMRAWAPIAQRVLYETSVSDRATITLEELAEIVQEESGVRTKEAVSTWITRLTDRVTAADPDIPIPVPPAPTKARATRAAAPKRAKPATGATPTAAASSATITGSTPAVPATSAAPKATAAPKRPRGAEPEVTICPTCFMALPASGICDNCS